VAALQLGHMEGGERWLGFPLSTLAPLFSFFYFTRRPFILFSRFVSAVLGVGTPYALRVLLEPSGVGSGAAGPHRWRSETTCAVALTQMCLI
jgi:hypothetical protein